MALLHEIRLAYGESLEEVGQRMFAVLDEHVKKGHTVVSVSHAIDPAASPPERYTALAYIRGTREVPPPAPR